MPIDRSELETLCQEIGQAIGSAIDNTEGPHNVGFALLLFDFGPGGSLAYISNAEREDMVRVLHECLAHWEKSPRSPTSAPPLHADASCRGCGRVYDAADFPLPPPPDPGCCPYCGGPQEPEEERA